MAQAEKARRRASGTSQAVRMRWHAAELLVEKQA
jgi:hypothetical protein